MANLFVNLPTQAADGSGAAVDLSASGATKTLTVEATGAVFQPFVLIEISNAAAPASSADWAPVYQFTAAGTRTFQLACRWMRATVSQYRGGAAPVVNVGSDDTGTAFAELVAPTGDGAGAAVNTSELPLLKTITVGGAFRGAVIVEVSADAGMAFSQLFVFYAPGSETGVFAADFMRVTRNGVPGTSPGTPIVNVGACSIGGGGSSEVFVDGTTIAGTGAEEDPLRVADPLPIDGVDLGQIARMAATATFAWSSTADPAGVADVGIARNAAGLLEVTSGTAGTLRDLRMRTLYASTNVAVANSSLVRWSSTSAPTASADTGLARAAAGTVEVNSGVAGALRDLVLRTLYLGATSGPTFSSGAGSPEGVVTAPVGSTYLRTGAGGGVYTKASGAGNTGWIELATSQGSAMLTDADTNSTTNEVVVCSFTVAANTFRAGDTYAWRAVMSRTGTSSSTGLTVRLRIGPTTLTGAAVYTSGTILTTVAGGLAHHGQLVIRGIGTAATGRAEGFSSFMQNGAGSTGNPANSWQQPSVAIDTTVDNLVELTMQSGGTANSFIARSASIARILRGA